MNEDEIREKAHKMLDGHFCSIKQNIAIRLSLLSFSNLRILMVALRSSIAIWPP